MARRFNAMPIAMVDNALQVAMANPSDIFALEALGLQSRMRIEPIAASEKEIQEATDFNYKGFGQIEEQISRIPTGAGAVDEQALIEAAEDTPVASALRLIIDEAAKARASDIHLAPEENRLRIRYRIDGALQDVMSLPLKIHPPLTSRIKIMADMNIADHLRPQDGQFSTEANGRPIDIRVATSPTVHGETTVLRLLDKSLGIIDLPQLGFSVETLAKYENMLKVPFGMILISGPTGAGKTTTLYASVNKLDKISRNIITIEDPVEYRFANMNQIQVNPKAGLVFASGLRSILRLDPDVILVGEIRDAETARIAIQAALTGHLVLSSIHANDAISVIFRLLDLDIEAFLVSAAVIGVVAQRMVRRICPDCCDYKEAPLIEQLAYAKETGEKRTEFLYGAGCELCSYTGYRGRTGIFEVLPISDEIRMQILKGASTSEVRQQAMREGMLPLIKDGMLKVKAGISTPSEVLRNAYFIE
jgi:general secretion pathway protein E